MLVSMSVTDWSDVSVADLLPTGTVTLLLADVEGSTRLWETRPQDMAAAVALLDRAVGEVVAAHGGVRPVEQGEGDSFVVAFGRASDAVACALALQRTPLAPIRLRIGLHTGDVTLRGEGNYIGPTINRTARLRDLAHGGQTVLSGVTEELVADALTADAWLADLGMHQLRDLPRPARVVQLCHPDLRNEFPPLRAPENVGTHNLPTLLTSFVGRAIQMAEVRGLVADNRLVTLTGAGGAGKTRLAVQIAAGVAAEFRDGAWYVDLAPVTHPEVVAVTVARALGLPDQAGRSTIDTLLGFVGDRQFLIVLDNCEHVLDASASLVTGLLGACPALRLLATSREPIAVSGEVTFPVPSLTLADEAIELFTDRARRVRPDFGVTDDNAAIVAEICARLDGMPLAIELAAARVRALSLNEILDSLHDRFKLLTGGARTAVRRQQTLRASVDWSHALLTEPERILFRRLAVFLGGFDLKAAQVVTGDPDVERYQVLDELTLLVDKSLVMAEIATGRTRYRLLETVRQYALEKLGESGESDAVRTRHRDHYVSMANTIDPPAGPGREQRVEQAEVEIDNLRSAFVWSLENSDVATGLRLATSLQPLWLTRGRMQEGLDWLDAALNAPNADEAGMPAARVGALADRCFLRASLGLFDCHDTAADALRQARELDDPALVSRALVACGAVTSFDADAARAYFDEGAVVARKGGDSRRLRQIMAWQATLAVLNGDHIGVDAVAAEGLALADAAGDRFTSRQLLWAVSCVQEYRGDLAGAIARSRQVIADATAVRDRLLRVIALLNESFALSLQGEINAAQVAADAIVNDAFGFSGIYEDMGSDVNALVRLAAGDAAGAFATTKAGQSGAGSQRPSMGVYISFSAMAAAAAGDLATARRWADDAVSVTKGWYVPSALMARARIAIAENKFDLAEGDLHDALVIAAKIQAYLFVPDIFECLGYVAGNADRCADAARLFGAADALRQRMGSVRLKVFDDDHEARCLAARDALGQEAFGAAYADGEALSTEAAIGYARRGRGERKRPSSGWESLTPAELDVVRLVCEGLPNKDIAERLFVSPRTVQAHLSHAYSKLGLTSRVQLAQEASRHG
jgi:predicted ATPase/class 3 adenylate cyclase/DNA-binding CsgD family transcriptional regulator